MTECLPNFPPLIRDSLKNENQNQPSKVHCLRLKIQYLYQKCVVKITGNGQYQCLPNFPLHLFRTMGITRSHIFPASVLPFLHCLSGLSEARNKNKKTDCKKTYKIKFKCALSLWIFLGGCL